MSSRREPGGGLVDRWRAHAAYAWQNDTGAFAALHHWVDAATGMRPRVTESVGDGGGPALMYAGVDDGLVHVLPFLEQCRDKQSRYPGDATAPRRNGRRASWREVVTGVTAPDAELIAVGCFAARARRLPRERALLLPFRVSLEVPVDGGADGVRRRVSRKDRQEYVRERQRRSWACEVADRPEDFDHFYDRMHRPTMQRRHGAATRSERRDIAYQCLFRRGVLLFLREDGERVAGMLCRLDPARGTLMIRLAGVRDGAESHYRSGTHMAMYLSVLEWAATNGLTRVNLSGCEPFLSKGIFQFKRKLHPEVVLPANHFAGKRLWLQVRRDTDALRDFLVANPPLTIDDDGRLRAVYFHDRDRPARTGLRWECPGIVGSRLVDLDEFLVGAPAGAAAHPVRT